jgi:hypothetical protein
VLLNNPLVLERVKARKGSRLFDLLQHEPPHTNSEIVDEPVPGTVTDAMVFSVRARRERSPVEGKVASPWPPTPSGPAERAERLAKVAGGSPA